MRRLLSLLFLSSAVAWSPGGAGAQLPPLALEVGDRFPNVVLQRAEDGSKATMQDFVGEKVVLHVFASW